MNAIERAHFRLFTQAEREGRVTTHVKTAPAERYTGGKPPKRINRRFTVGMTIKRR